MMEGSKLSAESKKNSRAEERDLQCCSGVLLKMILSRQVSLGAGRGGGAGRHRNVIQEFFA